MASSVSVAENVLSAPSMSRPNPFPREDLERAEQVLASQPRTVRFQEVDAAGTVFFPRILEYFADAYIDHLARAGVDLPGVMKKHDWVAPLVHAEADFLGPMRFGDAIVVEVVAAKVGGSSYSIGYRARAAEGGKILAVGHTAHVVVDGATFRPIPVPEIVRAALGG